MPAKIEDLILIGKQTDFAPVWASFHARAASPQGIARLIRKSTSAGVRQHPGGARIRSG